MNPTPQERDQTFQNHIMSIVEEGVKKWQCLLCGKITKLKGDIMDHIECKHDSSSFNYGCRYCHKILNTNKSLRTHEYKHRLNESQQMV